MKKLFLIPTVLFVLLVGAIHAQTPTELFDSGMAKYNESEFEGAIEDFTKAISIKPDYWQAFRFRAYANYYRDSVAASLPDFMQASKLNPGYYELYFEIGRAKSLIGDYIGAIRDYKKAFAIYPGYKVAPDTIIGKVYGSYAIVLMFSAEPDSGALRKGALMQELFRPVDNYSLAGNEPVEFASLADSTIRNLLFDSAIVYLNIAKGLDSKGCSPLLRLGNAYYKRNHDADTALIFYKQALDCSSSYYDAAYNLGVVYNEKSKPYSAKEYLLKAVRIAPGHIECRLLLAQVYAKLNNPTEVEYWVNSAKALGEVKASEYYQIGTSFGKVGNNLEQAVLYISEAARLSPTTELYLEDLAVAYGINGNYDDAIRVSEQLIKLNPNYAPAYLNLAVSYSKKGNKKLEAKYKKMYDALVGTAE